MGPTDDARASRRPRHALLVGAVVATFSGCSLVFPLDDYAGSGGRDDAGLDAERPDAAIDAAPEAAPPARYCAGVDASYCEDFDGLESVADIGLVTTQLSGTVTVVPNDAATSPPNTFVAAIPFHDGGIGRALVDVALPFTPQSSVTLRFTLQVETTGSIALGGLTFVGSKQSTLTLIVGDTSFYLQDGVTPLPTPDAGTITHPSNAGAPFGGSRLVPGEIRVSKTGSAVDASLTVDGVFKRQTRLQPGFVFGTSMRLALGISYDGGQVPRAPRAVVDDVEVVVD